MNIRLWLFSGLLLLLLLPGARAQVFFSTPKPFVVEQACDAHTSIKKGTGAVALEVGKAYRATGLNKAEGTHAFIQVANSQKWVALSCGRFDGEPPVVGGNGGNNTQCLPFFDSEDNPVRVGFGGDADITPPAPVIEPFGRAVNLVCGEPGKETSRDEFRNLLRSHPEVLARLMRFTSNTVYQERGARASADLYLDDLTDAWYNIDGFDHIFCGEPVAGGSIGGLHFRGRYAQLQETDQACRLRNFAQNEVVPGVIYTMGVRMILPRGGVANHSTKGYGLTFSAEDILKAATRAFSENPTQSTTSVGCLLDVVDDQHQFLTVFVNRKSGIRTFFPDATPDHNRNDPCSAQVVLPPAQSIEPANRAPLLAQPIADRQAPATRLTELNVVTGHFTDPDGDKLNYAATLADGTPLPLWMDFDPVVGVLMLLPERTQAGQQVGIRITASDGDADVSDELVVSIVVPNIAIVPIDAAQNDAANPLALRLPAGDYRVELLGTAQGARFDAWRPDGNSGWQSSYTVASEEFVLAVLANGSFTDASEALNHGNKVVLMQLDREQDVRFYIDTTASANHQGGVSLRLNLLE